MYRVSPGDTLIGIARQFAMDVDDVSRQNKLDDGDALKVGSLLRLRVKRDLIEGAGSTASRDTATRSTVPSARKRWTLSGKRFSRASSAPAVRSRRRCSSACLKASGEA